MSVHTFVTYVLDLYNPTEPALKGTFTRLENPGRGRTRSVSLRSDRKRFSPEFSCTRSPGSRGKRKPLLIVIPSDSEESFFDWKILRIESIYSAVE